MHHTCPQIVEALVRAPLGSAACSVGPPKLRAQGFLPIAYLKDLQVRQRHVLLDDYWECASDLSRLEAMLPMLVYTCAICGCCSNRIRNDNTCIEGLAFAHSVRRVFAWWRFRTNVVKSFSPSSAFWTEAASYWKETASCLQRRATGVVNHALPQMERNIAE